VLFIIFGSVILGVEHLRQYRCPDDNVAQRFFVKARFGSCWLTAVLVVVVGNGG
jgi:hypothetical protein